VVVTHGVQESQAWATVTWDNAFGTSKEPMLPLVHRVPFVVPHTVPWESLAQMLSIKFEQTAGKGLEDFQLKSLKQKLLPDSLTNLSVEAQVSFTRLSKLPLTGTSFSFWEWFYSAMKLVEKHALRSWKNGSIYGFIARKDAEIALQGSNPGTFLVRFSDTVLGGITITYVAKSKVSI
jgi:signal transducer and activator of transcription 5B